jgi:protein-S-isoprenylcysteine O-methyltransferase Ste14
MRASSARGADRKESQNVPAQQWRPSVSAGAARPPVPLVARIADATLGLTAFGWAAREVVSGRALTLVGATLAGVNLAVGLLFLLRRPPERSAGAGASALCLVSVGSSGVVLAFAPAPELWSWAARGTFVGGAIVAVGSLLVLGRSFGVLPAMRGLVRAGPYRLVRHPAYLGELAMVLGAALAACSPAGWGAAALGLALGVVRIVIEERLLATSEAYRAYQLDVRFRLLPGLW